MKRDYLIILYILKMANSESLGFRIVSVIILTIIAGFALAVIIYFNQIKQGKTITTSEASSMLVISGIIFAITIFLWIWALIRLFFSKKDRDEYTAKATTVATQAKTATTQYLGQSNVSLSQAKLPSQFYYGNAPVPMNPAMLAPTAPPAPMSNFHTVLTGPAPRPAVAETPVPSGDFVSVTPSIDTGSIPISGPISADVDL